MALVGKVFVITGGASGIGLATAKILADRRATVCIGDADPEALERVDAYFKDREVPFSVTAVDISDRQQVESWVAGTRKRFGRLDGAANVAGIIGKDHGIKTIAQLDDNEWTRIIAVNLTGCMYCMRAELNNMGRGGAIVNVASIHGTKGIANHGAYAASKHGVIGLTRVAAKENGAAEIRINAVAPGSVYTPMMQRYWDEVGPVAGAAFDDPSAFQRQSNPEEVANVIVFLLSPESSFVSGSVYSVDGAWL